MLHDLANIRTAVRKILTKLPLPCKHCPEGKYRCQRVKICSKKFLKQSEDKAQMGPSYLLKVCICPANLHRNILHRAGGGAGLMGNN